LHTGVASRSDVFSVQPTPTPLLSNHLSGSAAPTSGLHSAGFSSNVPFALSHGMGESPNALGTYAPIFGNTTVMPFYPQLYSFHSDRLGGDYPTAGPLETSDGILPTSVTENQEGIGERSGRQSEMPY